MKKKEKRRKRGRTKSWFTVKEKTNSKMGKFQRKEEDKRADLKQVGGGVRRKAKCDRQEEGRNSEKK